MKMKRIAVLLILLAMAAGTASGQVPDIEQILKRIELSEEEIEWFTTFQAEIDRQKKEAQIELNIAKAQLEKLLFPVDADMKAVEKLLRTTVEWRLQLELTEIRWRVEVRKKLGDEKFEKLLRLIKVIQQQAQNPNSDAAKREAQRSNP
jgi:hypothetical protein